MQTKTLECKELVPIVKINSPTAPICSQGLLGRNYILVLQMKMFSAEHI